MSHRPFRFVHASDLHLELPLQGVSEVPGHLRDAFLEAPYAAARRVFDAVLAEEAEFLVLSGDVLYPPHTGPRGPLFLLEQFRRLAERDIAVYWAGGSVDPAENWPAVFALPANVHAAPAGRTGQWVHQRAGAPLAHVLLAAHDGHRAIRAGEFTTVKGDSPIFGVRCAADAKIGTVPEDAAGLFTVAAVHGNVETAALGLPGIHYWALGGRHDCSTLFSSPQVAHYAGSPQGRRPEESGAHGCTLVQVDEHGQARTTLVPTDSARWLSERVVVDESTGRAELEGLLRQRMHALVETTPKMDLLVSWTIAGSGPLPGQLRRGPLAVELLAALRTEHGFASPAAWSVSLEVEPLAGLPPEWYEQDTFRGDFLRAVRQWEMNPGEALELESYMAESHLAGTLAGAATFPDASARQHVLHEATWLGADLLSGEEVAS